MGRSAVPALLALGLAILTSIPARATTPRERGLHQVPPADCEIQVDGVLDDPCWGDALALELEYETWPAENAPPAVRTTCRLTYDSARLFVGCTAEDPEPSRIRARLSDRDAAFDDDFVGIVLDTFNDERRAFEFFVNPLGVQMDLLMDDVGGSEDSSWDAIWISDGRVTEAGYEVEMAIPFTSLRFQRGEGDQVWGLDMLRMHPRDQRRRIGLNPLDRNVDCYLCQAAKVAGFTHAEPGKNLEVVPTLTLTRSDERVGFTDASLEQGDPDAELGVTARWGFTPNLTLSGTVNPDFSQVEADVAQLSANEQFALFFPERRPFFLEGADLFETPIDAVYTRTVADPDWGAKVTGKEGANALGISIAQDTITNLLIPGVESSSVTTLDEPNLSGVLRYRRDVGKSSAVGAIVTGRDGDGYRNQVAGFDALWRPSGKDTIRAQFLGSQTRYPEAVAAEFDQPGGSFGDRAFELNYRHAARRWTTEASYVDYGEDFRADSGFVPRVDFRQGGAAAEYRWLRADKSWREIELGTSWSRSENQQGQLIERLGEAWFNLNGPMQSFLATGAGLRTRVFNEVAFDQDFAWAYFELTPVADLSVYLDSAYGDQVDFGYAPSPGVARQGRQIDLQSGVRFNVGRHLRTNLDHTIRRLNLDEGLLFDAAVTELRLVWQFDTRSFVRLINQFQVTERNPELYADDVAPKSRDLATQLLYTYKVNPQTAIFVGYSDQRGDTGYLEDLRVTADDLRLTGRSFFVKLGYAWLP